MKKSKATALVALVIAFSIIAAPLVNAGTKNTNSPSDVDNNIKSAMQKFKQDQKTFYEALKVYEAARRAINKAFKERVDKALSSAKSRSTLDKTQLQKQQGAIAKQRAVIAAIAIRDAAIEALGPAPIPPTPPAKGPRMEKNKKPQAGISPNPSSN